MERYYIAYGSNLNVRQMRERCPGAEVFGTTKLYGWELLFKGSKTGSYLTIEPRHGGTVPVVIWKVTPNDERALDRYEGYPTFYYKKTMKLKLRHTASGKIRQIYAFAYIMHEDRPIGVPSWHYMDVCLEGYDAFGFDIDVLYDAYEKCAGGVL